MTGTPGFRWRANPYVWQTPLVQPLQPADFYTGLVAELYALLRSSDPDPEPYARFVAQYGEPALELGCGDGDPLLELRSRGLDIEGLDSSADMLERCRIRALEQGLDVVLHHSRFETMDLGKLFRSIYLAGPTFNLLADDRDAIGALRRINGHLSPNGAALIPLFIPHPVSERYLGQPREHESTDGTVVRCTPVSVIRDEAARRQSAVLRYERTGGGETTTLEREWVLHWHTQPGFRDLAAEAGLRVCAVLDSDGKPATDLAQHFVFILERA